MAYIGVSPSNGVRRKHTYTATAAQTSFSGAGAEGITLGYLDSNYVDVYQNGVKLSEADYTSTSGTAIVLATGATVSDMIEVVVYDVFSVADTVSKSAGGTFDGNVTMAGTLGVTGAVTANAGVVVDNITIDGTEIDLSSGDLTLDVEGDIILDANGAQIRLSDNGTQFGLFGNENSDLSIQSSIQDKDMIFQGNDGGAGVTALTLDMSDAGTAIFGHDLKVADNNNMQFGSGPDLMLSSDGTNGTIENQQSNGDILFKGSDAGSTITALTLDMSSAGKAIFNAGLAIGGTGDANTLNDYEEGTWTPTVETATGYQQQYGEYVKVGRMVYLGFDIRTNGVSAAGNELNGFPFTVSNSNAPFGAVNVGYYSGLTTAVVWLSGYVRVNASGLYFTGNSNGHTGTTIQHNTFNVFNADTRILGHVVYFTT